MNGFNVRHLIALLCTLAILSTSAKSMAAAFQLFEQDGASVANYHAGYAALATDASIAFYNPAGMTRIKNQQLVLGTAIIPTDFKYQGSVTVTNMITGMPSQVQTYNNVTAQGGVFNAVPDLHYVAPITDRIHFGFSIVVPFGLKTNYGRSTPLQFAATLTSIQVINYTPSLAAQVTNNFSFGAGVDIQRVSAEFDSVGFSVLTKGSNTASTNKANGTGYGFHLGGLYEFNPQTRAGLSYHSQVVHHLSGTSAFEGPIAEAITPDFNPSINSSHATTRITLPPYTALSGYHQFHPKAAIMGSLIYTQWNIIKTLTLNNVAGAVIGSENPIDPSTNIIVSIPQYFRNSWNVAIGADYYPTDQIILRGGLGYDQTPVKNAYRNVQLPDNDRFILALGGHFQATHCLGMDLGWAHLFVQPVTVNPPPQVMGAQMVGTTGRVKGGADVFTAQLTWDIDKPVVSL